MTPLLLRVSHLLPHLQWPALWARAQGLCAWQKGLASEFRRPCLRKDCKGTSEPLRPWERKSLQGELLWGRGVPSRQGPVCNPSAHRGCWGVWEHRLSKC